MIPLSSCNGVLCWNWSVLVMKGRMRLIELYPIYYLCLKSPLKDGTQIGPYISNEKENLKYSVIQQDVFLNQMCYLLLLFVPNLMDLFRVSVFLDRRYRQCTICTYVQYMIACLVIFLTSPALWLFMSFFSVRLFLLKAQLSSKPVEQILPRG